MSKLSLDAIRMVQAIKSTGSFSMAASILHKTPSAISYRVSSIEERLGVKLFHRNGPIVTLTPQGHTLLNEGEWIINAVESLEKRITTHTASEEHFRIACGSLFPTERIFSTIAGYMSCKNHQKLDIQQTVNAEEWSLLENNSVDMIVTTEQHPLQIEAQTKQLCNTKYICCVAPSHNFFKEKKTIDRAQLSKDILILQSDDLRRVNLRNISLITKQKSLLVSDLSTQLCILKKGIGHAFIPFFSVANEIQDGTLVIVDTDLDFCDETFWLAWHPGNKSRSLNWWQNHFMDDLITVPKEKNSLVHLQPF